MEHILEKARELGRLIAESQEFTTLNRLSDKVSADPDIADLYAEYADIRDQIAAMELDGEDEDTLDELEEQAEAVQEKINRADGMLEVNMARLTFNRMMDSVNHALQCQLTGEDEFAEPAGCGSAGGCGGCTGCGSAR